MTVPSWFNSKHVHNTEAGNPPTPKELRPISKDDSVELNYAKQANDVLRRRLSAAEQERKVWEETAEVLDGEQRLLSEQLRVCYEGRRAAEARAEALSEALQEWLDLGDVSSGGIGGTLIVRSRAALAGREERE